MAITVKQLIEYARAQLGKPYWYGTYGQIASKSLHQSKRAQYPNMYTASDFPKQYGLRVHDCVGLIKGACWSDSPTAAPKYASNGCPDVSANGMIERCKEQGSMASMPDVPGLVVWFSGHIGVYVGGGRVIEARGHAYGVVETKLSARPWKKWGKLPATICVYDGSVADPPAKAYKLGDRQLSHDMRGGDVKELQNALIKLGYALPKYGADADYGTETKAAVTAFQKAKGLNADGIYGKASHAALTAALSGTEISPAPTGQAVIITGDTVYYRDGPNTKFKQQGVARKGERYELVGASIDGSWHAVVKDGAVVWISGKFARKG